MISACFLLLYPLCATTVSHGWAASEDSADWTPAQAYSVQVGTSLIGDLTRAVGKPKDQTDNENLIMRGSSTYKYDVSWPSKGELWATVDAPSKRILELWFKPEKGLMSDVIKEFGSDYTIKRYRMKKCEKDPYLSTICPDRKGPIVVFEYPTKGIVVFPGPDGKMNDLIFSSEPPWMLSCRCGGSDGD